jgi:Immunity protein 35
MLTYEEAVAKAREAIAALPEPLPSRDIVVVEDRVQPRARGWVFPFQTREFLETRDPRKGLLGAGPIFVDKFNGSVHQVPTGGMQPWIEAYDRIGIVPSSWPYLDSLHGEDVIETALDSKEKMLPTL